MYKAKCPNCEHEFEVKIGVLLISFAVAISCFAVGLTFGRFV